MSTATKDDTTAAEAKAADSKPPAWRRRTTPLTDKARADRVTKYPNPETVNIDDLIAATKAEAEITSSGYGQRNAWSYLYYMQVSYPTKAGRDRAAAIVAEHEQWDSESKAYTQWMRNPRLGDVTEVPLAVVFRQWKAWIRDNPGSAACVDNIAGALGITYAPTVTTFDVNLSLTVTDEMLRSAGYSIDSVPPEPDNNTTREYLAEAIKTWLRQTSNTRTIQYTINTNASAPTA